MTVPVVLSAAAAIDIAEAYTWYEEQRPGLGTELLDNIDQTLALIGEGPHRYPVVMDGVRRALLRRFPYSVYFQIEPNQIWIVGVLHQHRHPLAWRRRR